MTTVAPRAPCRFVNGDRVRGGVSGDAHEMAIDRVEQIEGGGRIITRRLGQRVDTDHAGLIDAKVEFSPATSAAATVFRGGPLTFPNDGQTRAVEHEMGRCCMNRNSPAPALQDAQSDLLHLDHQAAMTLGPHVKEAGGPPPWSVSGIAYKPTAYSA